MESMFSYQLPVTVMKDTKSLNGSQLLNSVAYYFIAGA